VLTVITGPLVYLRVCEVWTTLRHCQTLLAPRKTSTLINLHFDSVLGLICYWQVVKYSGYDSFAYINYSDTKMPILQALTHYITFRCSEISFSDLGKFIETRLNIYVAILHKNESTSLEVKCRRINWTTLGQYCNRNTNRNRNIRTYMKRFVAWKWKWNVVCLLCMLSVSSHLLYQRTIARIIYFQFTPGYLWKQWYDLSPDSYNWVQYHRC